LNDTGIEKEDVKDMLTIQSTCYPNYQHYPVKHLVYASFSSVYGNKTEVPYFENDRTDSLVSLYAATKKSNELMAYAYSHLKGKSIKMFNNGNLKRNFTYIDDIIE
jgi:UDP-glucuronate 4-epimerase